LSNVSVTANDAPEGTLGRRQPDEGAATTALADGEVVDGASRPVRRAPFSDNPALGARGLRTQQRILDGALQVFGEHGYDRATLDQVAQAAGCSRVSIYQYFSGKDDLFRHLAGQVARQLRASTEALAPITPDADGWEAVRSWVGRYAEIHRRHAPVFRAFAAAAASDAGLEGAATSTAMRDVAVFQARLATAELPPRQLTPLIGVLVAAVSRAVDLASLLRAGAPDAYASERTDAAIADVVHRTLFGLQAGINVRPPLDPPPRLVIGPVMTGLLDHVRELQTEATQPGRRALAALLDVGDDVVAQRGYTGVRVDHVVDAAGVSHGAFYRYFDNVDEFVRVVALRAFNDVATALAFLPERTDRASLRRWLREYHAVHLAKGPMIRVWVEAVEEVLRTDRPAVFDWGRRRMARLLAGRGFGDVEMDAVVLLATVEAFAYHEREPAELDAVVRMVERGFFGRGA
jgi:AcrR family transcriptional regulator